MCACRVSLGTVGQEKKSSSRVGIPRVPEARETSLPLKALITDAHEAEGQFGGTIPFSSEIQKHICGCHNFFPLSSVQIIIIPACCLLCVL